MWSAATTWLQPRLAAPVYPRNRYRARSRIKVNLTGAKIIGSWRDPKTNIIYSVAELDMKHVKDTLGGVQDMNTDLKRYIETQADNIFDRVAKEKK
jgi:hypothetical protein